MLRTLTAPTSEGLHPHHVKALRQVRTAPFGILRLLLEEVLAATWGHPPVALDELDSLVALLGDPPAGPQARKAWYDLHANLEAYAAVVWAQLLEPSRATAALERAAGHRSAGSGDAEGAVTLLIARAECELQRHAEAVAERVAKACAARCRRGFTRDDATWPGGGERKWALCGGPRG